MHIELIDSLKVQNTLGESVLWDERTGHIWWVDIQEKRFYQYYLKAKTLVHFTLPERPCSIGLTSNVTTLLIAFESGFALFDILTRDIQWLTRPEADNPKLSHPKLGNTGRRLNDGRVDRQGRFWAGTMVEDESIAEAASGKLYRLGTDRTLTVMAEGLSIPNGICWSPDGTKFYLSDSQRQIIFTYDYAQKSGQISNKRVFARTSKTVYPDGADMDSQGFMWSAQWGGGQVVRYAADGRIDYQLPVPAIQPTCIAFGGADMSLLFVTSARDGLSTEHLEKSPQSGNLFIFQTNITGLQAPKYRLD